MKKRIIIILLLLSLALALGGCGRGYTAEYGGTVFTVDTEKQTITQGSTVYQFEIADQDSGTRYTIIYPDGAAYTMTYSGAAGTGGGDARYYEADRLDGDILIGILMDDGAPADPITERNTH